jgi:hypothetical protein
MKRNRKKQPKNNSSISTREHARDVAGYGAAMQLDRHGAHRQRLIPNKKREQNRRACRDW